MEKRVSRTISFVSHSQCKIAKKLKHIIAGAETYSDFNFILIGLATSPFYLRMGSLTM